MSIQELNQTIEDMIIDGKGILAADESVGTMGKRLADIGLDNTEENRRQYRSLLATTPNLNDYVSGVILFEETFEQACDDGENIAKAFAKQGIVPGIKVDKGLIPFASNSEEKITQGLDGLPERLAKYKALGARFAKWRAVFSISDASPSQALVQANAQLLARYAAICQEAGIVPIVEPEVLMDGPHDLDLCADVTEEVLHEVFNALYDQHVSLEHMILKPNMLVPGTECENQEDAQTIALATLTILRRTVPAAVPSINFLSGGQSAEQATENLHAINSHGEQPWYLSFSFGRALQSPCLAAWQGKADNIPAAQTALYKCAKANGHAAMEDAIAA